MADVVNEADMVDGGDDSFTPLRANLKEYEKELKSSLQDFKNEVKKYLYIILTCNIVVLAVGIGSIRIANSSHQLTLDDKLSTHELTLDEELFTYLLTLDDKLLTHQQTLDDKLLTHQQTLDGKLSILRHMLAADQIAIRDMHEFLLLQVISGKDVPTTLIDTIIGIISNLNYSLAFKRKLHIAWFQFKIQKQKPHVVTGLTWPWKLAVNSGRQIVVSEVDGHSVTVIKGKQLLNLKGFTHPSGVAITSDGYILVTDHHRLQKVSYDGKIKSVFGSIKAGSSQQELKYPDGIAIHPHTGQVYIVDRGNHRIKVLNSDLSYNYSFGEKGSNNRQFDWPTDVAFDSDGYLYVSDRNNNRIQKLTSQGDFVLKFSSKGLSSGRRLKDPSGITIDSYGLVYVKDSGNNDISIFDTSGNFWDTVSNGYGSGGIAINNSTMYICDPLAGNLMIF